MLLAVLVTACLLYTHMIITLRKLVTLEVKHMCHKVLTQVVVGAVGVLGLNIMIIKEYKTELLYRLPCLHKEQKSLKYLQF